MKKKHRDIEVDGVQYGWVYMLHFTLGCETAKRY